jgi:sec-independent protein translocase protein TatA
VIQNAAGRVSTDANKLDRSKAMMGLDNPMHIAFLFVLLLLVFGAKRLPELGRSLGSGLRGFKETISGEDSQSTIAQHAPSSSVQHASPAEPDHHPVEPAERAPAGTAV